MYLAHYIKNKKLVQPKERHPKHKAKDEENRLKIIEELDRAQTSGSLVVYLDECMFTQKTYLDTAWSNRRQNVTLSRQRMNQKALALIFACSLEKGVEHCQIYPKSVNAVKFIEYLRNLRASERTARRIFLFMDNLAVHKTKDVRAEMERL